MFTTHSCPPLLYFCSLNPTVSHGIIQANDCFLSLCAIVFRSSPASHVSSSNGQWRSQLFCVHYSWRVFEGPAATPWEHCRACAIMVKSKHDVIMTVPVPGSTGIWFSPSSSWVGLYGYTNGKQFENFRLNKSRTLFYFFCQGRLTHLKVTITTLECKDILLSCDTVLCIHKKRFSVYLLNLPKIYILCNIVDSSPW
jgi:hypothetical protein